MNTRLLRKRNEPPPHPILRAGRIAGGILLLAIGLFILLTPLTPGSWAFLIGGLWLLSSDIRLARRALMWVRLKGRRARRRYKAFRESRREDKEVRP